MVNRIVCIAVSVRSQRPWHRHVRAKPLASLTELRLGNNEIDADGACAIVESAHLHGLESLELRDNPIGADGARAIAAELMGRYRAWRRGRALRSFGLAR